MPRIEPIDAARAAGRTRELVDEFSSRGREPGPMVLAMANAPALLLLTGAFNLVAGIELPTTARSAT